jgi:hypothetical protein
VRDRLALLVADGLEIGDHAAEALDLGVPVVLAAVELLLQDRDAHRLVGDLLQGGPVLEPWKITPPMPKPTSSQAMSCSRGPMITLR